MRLWEGLNTRLGYCCSVTWVFWELFSALLVVQNPRHHSSNIVSEQEHRWFEHRFTIIASDDTESWAPYNRALLSRLEFGIKLPQNFQASDTLLYQGGKMGLYPRYHYPYLISSFPSSPFFSSYQQEEARLAAQEPNPQLIRSLTLTLTLTLFLFNHPFSGFPWQNRLNPSNLWFHFAPAKQIPDRLQKTRISTGACKIIAHRATVSYTMSHICTECAFF